MGKGNRKAQFEKWSPEKPSEGKAITETTANKNQFATRERANDFVRLMRSLPDPDPILRKMGRGITALQELLSDSHLESVWSVRCSTISGAEWFMAPGAEGGKEKEAAEIFTAMLARLDIPRIIEEMMDAVAFGYSPLEILWTNDSGRWDIADIIGKPPEWFEYNQENRLVFRTGTASTEELPENRFLVVRHRPSYANPYGVKVFSKCYWPTTFKKNGFRWWTVFVEKYGGAFMYGKYPNNASEQYKKELLEGLDNLIGNAVAIVPEGAEITITSAAEKNGTSGVHQGYIQMANAEISKAVLGQTLTTEIGAKGSYAAAQAHNLVRGDLAASDRMRISASFSKLALWWTRYNFGPAVAPPRFEFVKDEDLQEKRAKRDVDAYRIGWQPTKKYLMEQYGFQEDDFTLREPEGKAHSDFTKIIRDAKYSGSCPCGGHRAAQAGVFKKMYTALFTTKREKQRAKDSRLMREFSDLMIEAGQEAIDGQVEKYADALGTVDNFEDAREALLAAFNSGGVENIATVIDEIRFAAQGLGAHSAERGSHG